MASPFSRSLRSLDADRGGRVRWLLLLALLLFGGWGAWLFLADVPVLITSTSAQLQAAGEVHRVGAALGGRVVTSNLEVSRRVAAGDVLLVLDTSEIEVRIAEARKRAQAIRPQIAAARAEIATLEESLTLGGKGREAALSEARARYREARTTAKHKAEEVARLESLRKEGLISELEYTRAAHRHEELGAAARSLQKGMARLELDRRTEDTVRRARLDALRREVAGLEAQTVALDNEVAVLTHQISQSRVCAPIAGTLGEVAPIKAGSVVRAGDKLAALIPDGALELVATFPAQVAVGRIEPGQSAELRLAGFPWSQYGIVAAVVTSVAGEPIAGQVRVELDIDPAPDSPIPLRHGQPGAVHVEVERVTPAVLALRAAGQLFGTDDDAATSGGGSL